jgi:thioredoxin reductase (NADPH)
LRGELEAFETREDTEVNLANARERDFMGDVSMLQGTSILGSARVTSEEAEILTFRRLELRARLAEIPAVSKTIVDALIMRRRRVRAYREFADCVCWLRAARVTDISSMIFGQEPHSASADRIRERTGQA